MTLDQTWKTLSSLTMLGDVAHLMPPFAGEGANIPMLDALELSVFTSDKHNSLKETISFYEITMQKSAAEAAQMSLDNTEWMHSETSLTTMLNMFDEQ